MKCEGDHLKNRKTNTRENNNKTSNKKCVKKRSVQKIIVLFLVTLIIGFNFIIPILAEGPSGARVFISLSRDPLNIGKTFTLTLKTTPNGANIAIDSFQATIQYDLNKLELIMESGSPKITRPSGVPEIGRAHV